MEDGSLLEIKCPWGLRDQLIGHYISTFQNQKLYGEASSVIPKLAFLTADRENVLLNPNHVYYHQIQTQLHCTGSRRCYLFVWSKRPPYFKLEVSIETDYQDIIDDVAKFYLHQFLPLAIEIVTEEAAS